MIEKFIEKQEHLSFTFTPENQEKVRSYIAKYPNGKQASAVLPLLDLAQRQCGGWLPKGAIEAVALLLSMPFIRVLEIASFYTLFYLKPMGRYHVQVCGTTPCWLRGSDALKEKYATLFETPEGQITPDHLFSLTEVECLGACVNAPVVQINDDFFEHLTPDQFETVLQDLKNQASLPSGVLCAPKKDLKKKGG